MGRSPCCSKEGLNRGAWTALEDKILTDYIAAHGEGKWRNIPRFTGLKRCGKSCRLRWLNYLRPDIKRGNITPEEEDLIIRLHKLLGNRWSLIAGRLPGRTDNEIKNYWNTTLGKKVKGELPKQPKDSTVKRSKAKQPNVDIVPTIVIGTKLTKSDDIFLAQRKATAAVETNFSVDGNLVTSKNVVPELKFDEGSPSVASREDNFNNLVMDFDLSDLLLSDVHESEFWKLCQFDGGTGDSLDHPLHFSSEEIKGWVTDDGVRFNA